MFSHIWISYIFWLLMWKSRFCSKVFNKISNLVTMATRARIECFSNLSKSPKYYISQVLDICRFSKFRFFLFMYLISLQNDEYSKLAIQHFGRSNLHNSCQKKIQFRMTIIIFYAVIFAYLQNCTYYIYIYLSAFIWVTLWEDSSWCGDIVAICMLNKNIYS